MIAMKRLNVKPYTAVLLLVGLLSGCSGSVENSGASNNNAPPAQANSNSAPQPQIAQGNAPPAPTPAPLAVQTIPPPPAPAEKSAAGRNPNAANPSPTGTGQAPKLVLSDKKLDFGKQPQGKALVRAIVIKNGGLADLNIESVVPS